MKYLPLFAAGLFLCAGPVGAAPKKAPQAWASVEAKVVDHKGKPVEGAVVYALDAAGEPAAPKTVLMNMQDMDFDPLFVAVTVGDSVSFPNKDTAHHHVYSFSKVKKFDSRLYKDGPPKIVKFDAPGLVKVGCKIHDWMSGSVLVTQSTARAVTDEHGKAVLKTAAKDSVRVGLYHPRMRGKHEKNETVVPLKNGKGSASWEIKLKGKPARKSSDRKVYY